MKENIIDVLMYLFENHMEDSCNIPLSEELLVNELKQAGFDIEEISRAFDWLDGLAQSSKLHTLTKNAFRSLNPEEQKRLDAECWGFLLFLEQVGILNPVCREIILDRLMGLATEKIDLSQVKWVALMVLFNQRDQKDALKILEQLILTNNSGQAH